MSTVSDSSHSSSTTSASTTYEAARAKRFSARQPDKIHWDGSTAFREEPYRQLHHQNGLIGVITVRLLEASELKRSHWSAFALGPVKHLGLSKAHGDVSSYCTFSLGFQHHYSHRSSTSSHQNSRGSHDDDPFAGGDQKPAARETNHHYSNSSQSQYLSGETKSSPTVERNNNPVWDNCVLDLPLRKGVAPSDGMKVQLHVRVEEEGTAVENFLPFPGSSGGDRLLGTGQLDITELLMGEGIDGNPAPGVRDEWIPITLQQQQQQKELSEEELRLMQQFQYNPANDPLAPPSTMSSASSSPQSNNGSDSGSHNKNKTDETTSFTGMIRVLVSYQPNGMEPAKNDVVALESFARRNPNTSTCRPLLEPLQPLTVIDRRGSYLLCEYQLPIGSNSNNNRHRTKARKGHVRLHRNVVFVIERQNIMDAATNLALLPVDVALSTPVGKAVSHALAPAVSAGTELLMPTLLSLKLLWMAARTTAVASLSGAQALTTTLVREGTSSLLHNHNHQLDSNNSNHSSRHSDRSPPQRQDSGTERFVQL